ncbi:MAG: hypothetical protein AAFY65_20205 [Pseudomonadota bacterium]
MQDSREYSGGQEAQSNHRASHADKRRRSLLDRALNKPPLLLFEHESLFAAYRGEIEARFIAAQASDAGLMTPDIFIEIKRRLDQGTWEDIFIAEKVLVRCASNEAVTALTKILLEKFKWKEIGLPLDWNFADLHLPPGEQREALLYLIGVYQEQIVRGHVLGYYQRLRALRVAALFILAAAVFGALQIATQSFLHSGFGATNWMLIALGCFSGMLGANVSMLHGAFHSAEPPELDISAL